MYVALCVDVSMCCVCGRVKASWERKEIGQLRAKKECDVRLVAGSKDTGHQTSPPLFPPKIELKKKKTTKAKFSSYHIKHNKSKFILRLFLLKSMIQSSC